MSMKKNLLLRCVAMLCILATLMSPVSALAAQAPAESALDLSVSAETLLPVEDGSAEVADDTIADDIVTDDTVTDDTVTDDTVTDDTVTDDTVTDDTVTDDTVADGSPEDENSGDAVRGWVKDGDDWYYYGKDDIKQTGWLELDGELYYFAPETGIAVREWQTIDGETYYFGYSSRKALTGLWSIDGSRYFFNENTGAMEHSGLHTAKDGSIYFLNDDGIAHYGWKTMENGDKYYFGAARYALTGYWTVGGYKYFFNEDTGIMEHNGLHTAKDGSIYFLNDDGIAHYGWKTMENGDKYYFGAARYALTGLWTVGGYKYYFDETTGLMQTGWQTIDGEKYFFNLTTGRATSGWITQDDGTKCYLSYSTGKLLTGLWEVGDYYYYFDEETGVMQTGTGLYTGADGETYCLSETGKLKLGWQTIDGEKYYFSYSSAKMLTGLWKIGGTYYYYLSEHEDNLGAMQHSGLAVAPDGSKYYLNSAGRAQYGWQTIDGEKYYFGYSARKALTGLWTISGYKYYFAEEGEDLGVMQTGWQEVDGSRYFFNLTTGRATSGWITQDDGTKCYLSYTTGKLLTGFWEVGDYLYFFDENGIMLTGTGLYHDGAGNYYCLSETGRLKTGWQTIDGEKYYFSYSTGRMLTGLWKIGGTYYYYLSEAKENLGTMQANGLHTAPDGSVYFLNASGRAQYGWQTMENGDKYYFSSSTRKALTGLWTVGSYKYYFDESTGIMQTGWQEVDGAKYFFNLTTGRATSGWITQNDGTKCYLSYSTGQLLTGLWTVGSYKYYFDDNGIMQTGWVTTEDGSRYYFSPSTGRGVTGWQTIDGNRYYFSYSSYKMLTGLWKIGGTYYYYLSEHEEDYGVMRADGLVTGPDGAVYYLNSYGRAQYGWQTIDGNKYYFGYSSRAALTGVWTLSGYKYYFNDQGVMQAGTGLYVGDDGNTYCLSENGRLKTGWQTIDGNRYYFSTSSGKMLTGLWEIGSYFYYLDEETGIMQHSGWYTTADGIRCFLNEDGTAKTGWLDDESGNKYYLSSTRGGLATGLWKVGSYYYFFDENTGVMLSDGLVEAQDGSLYFLDAAGHALDGWQTANGNKYYFGATSRAALTGMWSISGYKYFFEDNGVLQVGNGLYTSNAGDTYYLSETGRLKTGWQTSGEDKFYFSTSSCKMLTGLWKISGYYYLLNDNPEADAPMGAMMKDGWATDAEGNRYYLNANGTAKGEWFTDTDGRKYYFGYSSRKALTGLWSIDGYRYFFTEEGEHLGSMVTDTWMEIDGDTYYFKPNGTAQSGWLTGNDGSKYLFCKRTNKMLTGWQNYQGNFYYFYPDGENKGTMAVSTTIGDYTIGSTGAVPLATKTGMTLVAQSYYSPTKYLLLTDTTNTKVGVFTGSQGNWELLYYWDCNCGGYGHETPTGTFSVEEYHYSFGNDVYTCYYGTAFYTEPGHAQWLFHSILYIPGTMTPQDGRLGYRSSNGCIRLSLTNSRWIYNNIPVGTTVVNY